MEDFLDLTVNASADSVADLVAVADLKAVAVETVTVMIDAAVASASDVAVTEIVTGNTAEPK